MESLQIGRGRITWLNGGVNFLDGGAMFGVVPKPLWGKKYPCNDKNQIELRTDPLLFQIDGKNLLIDTGIGNQKLTEKQLRNFGVLEESSVESSLSELDLSADDIDIVLMTHLHFDHACGLTSRTDEGGYASVFRNADIFTTDIEWAEMRNPNIRSINTYWEENWKPVEHQVKTFQQEIELLPGLRMIHSGGHSDGHAIIIFEDSGEMFIHMADLMATNAHQNKLWAMAYDDYPVTSVHQKEKWMDFGYQRNAWFTFYHDAYFRAIKFNKFGEQEDVVRRERYEY